MREESIGIVIGVSIGVVIGLVLAIFAFFCHRYHRKRSQIGNSSSRRAATIPIRAHGADSCTILSDSTLGPESPIKSGRYGLPFWLEGFKKSSNMVPASGLPEYAYKDLQKATHNFTTVIGQGAFGPVYKAQMSTGEIVAVKVLATNSKQGEKEFHTEVMLLGRLHHRNLVNLVGYCAEKGQHMLVYVYMSNGSLASHLYCSDVNEALCWDLRVNIALDVAKGLEYLHDGAVPPVIHRDIKSSNILLDQSMRARVADFGLSREEMVDKHAAIRGTFGYLDPEYISSGTFTKKSDVYSFGVLLFEIIAGRNPQQGLMEYVELAAMNIEGKVGWEEIVDSHLQGNFHVKELNEVAAIAYKCINRAPNKRPSMRDIVQVLTRILKSRHHGNHHKNSLSATDEVFIDPDQLETMISVTDHRREESKDNPATEVYDE
ncbi:calcium/calmodulin-regulated receptor-like kinase 1 [Vigna radiata var. radiata]|uniref:Calcium/calmodulin-regulated receptor-like kinase 1 n=1 Tax=Vigna radiata var. radiata TaxID=3916 RepID=A0A1S3TE70_VIGRR|nr:calcium/calmodulin-regulated receptor-like kinase 1 [Vigna radiata var. radiata]XP_014492070.1 calcium/calmodulin-regulated receptor-like kinase 1 [Vigna radiata var. radiata]XP_022634368.1 calcium/calmodulin-regulated receptor-like kinase 1 [Vigna radiata var. radiata]